MPHDVSWHVRDEHGDHSDDLRDHQRYWFRHWWTCSCVPHNVSWQWFKMITVLIIMIIMNISIITIISIINLIMIKVGVFLRLIMWAEMMILVIKSLSSTPFWLSTWWWLSCIVRGVLEGLIMRADVSEMIQLDLIWDAASHPSSGSYYSILNNKAFHLKQFQVYFMKCYGPLLFNIE